MQRARVGQGDKLEAMKKLSALAQRAEASFTPTGRGLGEWIAQERADSWKYGGRTVFGRAKPPADGAAAGAASRPTQLRLF